MGTKNRKLKIEGETIVFEREKSRFSIRKNKCYGACSVFLGLAILTLATAGGNVKADSAVSVEGAPTALTLVAPEGTVQHLPTETSAGYSLESDEDSDIEEVASPEKDEAIRMPSEFLRANEEGKVISSNEDINSNLSNVFIKLTDDPNLTGNKQSGILNIDNGDFIYADISFETKSPVLKDNILTIQLSKNLDPHGISQDSFQQDVKDKLGGTIGIITYDEVEHRLLLKFTEYASKKSKLTVSARISLLADDSIVYNTAEKEKFTVSIANVSDSIVEDVVYSRGAEYLDYSIDGRVVKTSDKRNMFKYVFQVNYLNKLLYQGYRYENLAEFTNGTDAKNFVDFTNVEVKVYKVLDVSKMVQSMNQDFEEESLFENVTRDLPIIKESDKIKVIFGNAVSDPYIVVLEGRMPTDEEKVIIAGDFGNTFYANGLMSARSDGMLVRHNAEIKTSSNVSDATTVESTYSIGDYVWEDINKDGVQNDGENSGIEGVIVKLLDHKGEFVKETKTGLMGEYRFDQLEDKKTYILQFETPKGYIQTISNNESPANDEADSDMDINGMAIVSLNGEDNFSIDAGFYKKEIPKGSVDVRYIDTQGNEIGVLYQEADNVDINTYYDVTEDKGEVSSVQTTKRPSKITKDGNLYALVKDGRLDTSIGPIAEGGYLIHDRLDKGYGVDAPTGNVTERPKHVT